MKKILLLVIAFAVYQNWNTLTGGYAEDNQVILYATDWCGYCAKTRTLLKDLGVPYLEFDIEKSEEGRLRYEALGGGGIPVLNINGSIVRGFNPRKIKDLLH